MPLHTERGLTSKTMGGPFLIPMDLDPWGQAGIPVLPCGDLGRRVGRGGGR